MGSHDNIEVHIVFTIKLIATHRPTEIREQSVYALFLYSARLESTPSRTLMALLRRFWPRVLSDSLATYTVPLPHFPSVPTLFCHSINRIQKTVQISCFLLFHCYILQVLTHVLLLIRTIYNLLCLCSPGGLAAEEPGQCFERGPMWCHPHIKEKTSEHFELDTRPAQERSLETAGPTGEHLECSLYPQHH